jgi:hypothetical protein
MHKVIAALMLTSACFTPALAQTKTPVGEVDARAECLANFKAADRDSNGTLSKGEMDASGKVIPTSLLSQNSVKQAQFMTACNASRPKGG